MAVIRQLTATFNEVQHDTFYLHRRKVPCSFCDYEETVCSVGTFRVPSVM